MTVKTKFGLAGGPPPNGKPGSPPPQGGPPQRPGGTSNNNPIPPGPPLSPPSSNQGQGTGGNITKTGNPMDLNIMVMQHLKPCKELGYKLSDYRGLPELNDLSYCLEFNSTLSVQGIMRGFNYSSIDFVASPCSVKNNPKCVHQGLKEEDRVMTNPNLRKMHEFLSKLMIKITILDASAGLEDVNTPIHHNVKSSYEMRINMFQLQFLDIMLGRYQVDTSYGYLFKTNRTEKSIFIADDFKSSAYREPTLKTFHGGYEPYVIMKLLASNRAIHITRNYESFLDVLSKVGGLFQSLVVGLAVFMTIHTNVALEKNLMNKGLLKDSLIQKKNHQKAHSKIPQTTNQNREDPQSQESDTSSLNTRPKKPKNSVVEKSKQLIKNINESKVTKYTYHEILCHKYLPFLMGKSSKERYQKDMKEVFKRLDIRNIISNSGKFDVFCEIFLKEYQLKLINDLQPKVDGLDDAHKKIVKQSKMTSFEAMLMLESKKEKRNGLHILIDKSIRDFIEKTVNTNKKMNDKILGALRFAQQLNRSSRPRAGQNHDGRRRSEAINLMLEDDFGKERSKTQLSLESGIAQKRRRIVGKSKIATASDKATSNSLKADQK